ncbi:LysR family transcriptional regulator [Pseudomonas lalucatii]|nr:LysR family transcriptional regulator [Pseudomonas lalucatii]
MNEDDLRLFLRIAALGTLSAAAREAHLSPAVVSHRLAQLEKQLGCDCFIAPPGPSASAKTAGCSRATRKPWWRPWTRPAPQWPHRASSRTAPCASAVPPPSAAST